MTGQSMSLSRRTLLGAGAFLLAGLPGLTLAAPATDRRFVQVILRGGLDGLAAVPPHGDRDHVRHRERIAITQPIDLDGFFGLHPALAPLMAHWQARELAVFQALGLSYRNRSHFDAQNVLETGSGAANDLSDGWLGRALASFGARGHDLGLAIGQIVPMVLAGPVRAASWSPNRRPLPDGDLLTRLTTLYRGDPIFADALRDGLEAEMLADQAFGGRSGGGPAGLARAAAAFLAEEQGARVAVLEVGGWDTHANQGNETGQLANRLARFAETMTVLAEGLQPVWDKTVILAVTEFGRTVRVNGSGGTDHGVGMAGFAMGGAVRGGRVIADWPGLDEDDLWQGRDLRATLELRSIYKSILGDHLGIPEREISSAILPDSRDAPPVKGLIA